MTSGDAENGAPFSTRSVHAALCRHLRGLPDIGARRAVLDTVLEAQNPFQPKAARLPRRWFVLFALLVTLFVTCFLYFDNLR